MTFITAFQIIVRSRDLYINLKKAFKVVAMNVEQAVSCSNSILFDHKV